VSGSVRCSPCWGGALSLGLVGVGMRSVWLSSVAFGIRAGKTYWFRTFGVPLVGRGRSVEPGCSFLGSLRLSLSRRWSERPPRGPKPPSHLCVTLVTRSKEIWERVFGRRVHSRAATGAEAPSSGTQGTPPSRGTEVRTQRISSLALSDGVGLGRPTRAGSYSPPDFHRLHNVAARARATLRRAVVGARPVSFLQTSYLSA
jgi:hypothetical protein